MRRRKIAIIFISVDSARKKERGGKRKIKAGESWAEKREKKKGETKLHLRAEK